jgi:NADPH:quinone reductase-like Zn-dependent oxidoreductase
MREAAALPLMFITAWQGLIDRARLAAGQSVLVQGGSGDVGHMAIQIARAFGAKVFATGAPSRRPVIERFGARFIDRSEPVAEYVMRLTSGRGFDIVYDTAGGATLDASFEAVSRSGHLKALATFSLLFGIGLAIQFERLSRHPRRLVLLLRRLLVLLAGPISARVCRRRREYPRPQPHRRR